MKVGRNQPCPCGSGEKYKKCCLGKEKVSSDLLYRRLGEAHDRLAHRLMHYGFEVFGENALAVALDEFMAWPDEGISDEDLADHQPLFYPWFIFNWEYEADPDDPQLDGPEGTTIAELYAANKANRLNHLEAQIIKATACQPFSFYEIQGTHPGKGYRLKDIFRSTVSNVIEKKGSENVRRGDILFGRVVRIDSITMLIGCGTVLIPPKMKPELIRFRQWLLESDDPITSRTLYEYDLEIRELYDTADLDESGQIIRVEIPWCRKGHHKNAEIDSTLLGQLAIEDRRLKVEVNSARRAEAISREIETRLGKHARYITTEIQSPDAMLETNREQEGEQAESGPDQDELMQIPEVREQIEKTLFAHWENWPDAQTLNPAGTNGNLGRGYYTSHRAAEFFV